MILTIDLGALAANWRMCAAAAGKAECAAVVKADAYGIGIERAGPALAAAGCRTFFVARVDEGRRLRAVAPDAAIYVLDGFLADTAGTYREHDLRPVLNSPDQIATWKELPGSPSCAILVDTGMNRLGLTPREARELSASADAQDLGLRLVMSHLACADTPARPLNEQQLARFQEIRLAFPGLPASFANSAGIFLSPDYHFDMVRPGIALYGAAIAEDRPPLATVVTAEARILQIRAAKAGETVGYGAGETLKRASRIAVVAAGYADGYPRSAGSSDNRAGGRARVRGRSARILGRVSMDLTALDVTDIPEAAAGDFAELFGPNLPVDEAAAAAGTIAYELLTGLSRRAHRVYVNGPAPA